MEAWTATYAGEAKPELGGAVAFSPPADPELGFVAASDFVDGFLNSG